MQIEVTTQEDPILEPTLQGARYQASMRRINYNDRNDRRWLSKHSLWALSHNLQVITRRCID